MNDYLRVNEKLSKSILADKYPHLHRNFSLWAYMRKMNNGGHFTISEVVELASQLLGKEKSHIRDNLIPHGKNIFWSLGEDNSLTIIGKKRVYEYFEVPLDSPGKVLLVPYECLFGKLQKLRSTLYEISVGGMMIARSTMQSKYNRVPETFRNYQKIAESKPIHNFTQKEDWINPETGELQRRQLSNTYQHSFFSPYACPELNNKYGWIDTVGYVTGNKVAVNRSKLYFKNHKELSKFRNKGWVKPGSTVYVKRKFKLFERWKGEYVEWEVVNIPMDFIFSY